MRQASRKTASALLIGAVGIALVSGAIALLKQAIAPDSLTALYLFAILPVAIRGGFVAAGVIAVAAFLTFAYFFGEPVHSFQIDESDTAAALRAVEIHAEALLMAKNGVEGVYTADPRTDPSAEFIAQITHMEALERRLRIMDLTALTLCMENGLPIHVFNMDDERNIDRIVSGERVGTLVST